uniref:Uncharacterized protein n=1 Tax=Siphoviridae sp. ctbIK24 TaxID=2827899 RepID=A0A8S5TPE5_9CAUD|nr:MAG TPA: hypothetical protein [Siphoviridae sp. ctbIK24]
MHFCHTPPRFIQGNKKPQLLPVRVYLNQNPLISSVFQHTATFWRL